MSDDKSFTPANPSLEENLRSYLSFLGVGPDEFVELTAITDKCMFTGGARGYAKVCALAQVGGVIDGVHGIYLVPNRMADAVGARYAPDEWHRGIDHAKDGDIERRRVVYIDLDPRRPSGTSATDKERRAAKAACDAVVATLAPHLARRRSLGIGSSGNGFQIHLATDLPTTTEVEANIKRLLSIVSVLHGGDRGYGHPVDVDLKVTNAARLAPAFGTRKTKGHDNTKEVADPEQRRPHRRSEFKCKPDPERLNEADLTSLVDALERGLTAEQRTALAELGKGSASTPMMTGKLGSSSKGEGPLAVAKRHPIGEVARWLGLLDDRGQVRCPGCDETNGVDLLPEVNRLKCLHNRCANRGRNGSRSGIDLVLEVGHKDATKENVRQAAIDICDQFGLEYRSTPSKERRLPTDEEAAAMGIFIDTYEPAELSKAVPNLEDAPAETTPTIERRRHNTTDLGNAERLRDRHGADIRYVTSWGKWIVWDGKRWVEDQGELRLGALANQTARSIYQEFIEETDPDKKRELAAWAKMSEGERRLKAMVRLATTLPTLHVHHEELDADPYALNVQNGIVNLRTGELGEHRRGAYCTKIAGVAYNPKADRSVFENAFRVSLPKDDVRAYVMKLMGKSLTANTADHILPIHYNEEGRNGKDTFLGSLMVLLGEYADEVPFEILENTGNSGHPTGLSLLFGKRFVLSSESNKGDALNVKLAKRLTGENKVQTRKMQQDFWGFLPSHTLHLATNNKPRILADPKDPIWERVSLIEWSYVPVERRDIRLKEKLRGEHAEGFFAAVVEACMAWQREGLVQPKSVKLDTTAYRDENDQFGDFVADHLVVEQGAKVRHEHLFAEYVRWAEAQGLKRTLAANGLSRELNKRKIGTPERDEHNTAWRTGVRIRVASDNAAVRDREAREQAKGYEAAQDFEANAEAALKQVNVVAPAENDVGLDDVQFSDGITLDLVEPLFH